MPLFKYTTLDRLDILENQQIRYTQPGAFNDPFEMPAFLENLVEPDKFPDLIDGVFDNSIQEEYEKFSPSQKHQISFEKFYRLAAERKTATLPLMLAALNSLAPIVRESLRDLDKLFGVLSLTETADNLLMWSHYADQHRGMVLEVDEHHETFNEDLSTKTEERQHRPVVYSDTRPTITLHNFDFTAFFFTKSQEWAYEKEVRIIKALNGAKRTIPTKQNGYDICLFELPASAVKRVILGARTTRAEQERIRKTLLENAHLNHIELQQANLEDRQFKLTFTVC
tara:strand:- start:6416 stop:7264 length:849 start_codon:yes stop_codon:yes gene_type:complete